MRFARKLSTRVWSATEFGNPSKVLSLREVEIPSAPLIKCDNSHVTVKVNAVSLNPIDHWMVNGRGKNLREIWEKLGNTFGLSTHDASVGVIPGRDFHATVMDGGERFKKGDHVVGVRHPFDSGSLQERMVLNENALFPENGQLSPEENACLPFVTSTIMSSLGISGGISLFGCPTVKTLADVNTKKILIVGATGGLGTVLTQLLLQDGATVDVIGGKEVWKIVNAGKVLDYHDEEYRKRLVDDDYDFVFDCADGKAHEWVGRFMKHEKSTLISYSSPLLQMLGSMSAMSVPEFILVHQKVQSDLRKEAGAGAEFRFGFFSERQAYFEQISKINFRPTISKVFDFESVPEAFESMVSESHFGKIVIRL